MNVNRLFSLRHASLLPVCCLMGSLCRYPNRRDVENPEDIRRNAEAGEASTSITLGSGRKAFGGLGATSGSLDNFRIIAGTL